MATWSGAAKVDLTAVCDTSTVLNLLGVDTAAGVILFSMPSRHPEVPGWLVELDAVRGGALLHIERLEAGRYGGSLGPGPVLVASRCGEGCLQVLSWQEGRWEPLGEPIEASEPHTFHGTYDRAGAAWVVLHGWTGSSEWVGARAYRFEGGRWAEKGSLGITAVGFPGAVPDKQHDDSILSGSGRFAARAAPGPWLDGIPSLPPQRRGQILPVAPGFAAYLGGDEALYLSEDGGATWHRSEWTPLRKERKGRILLPGTGYSLEAPTGEQEGSLGLVWSGGTIGDEPAISLSERRADGEWTLLATSPASIATDTGERLLFDQIFLLPGGRWILLTSCLSTPDGAGLAQRSYREGVLSDPELILLEPAW